MLGAGLLLTGLYALNPFNTATLDPRARLLGLTTYSIPSRSMTPTLEVGDNIAVNTAAYGFSEPQRGDVECDGINRAGHAYRLKSSHQNPNRASYFYKRQAKTS